MLGGMREALRCEIEIFYIGDACGMDRSIVEAAGIRFYGIKTGKLRRYFSLRNISDIFNIALGFLQAIRILKKEKPLLLFSKGGFVSVPPAAAAAMLHIPVWTHESDFSPGLATKINSRFASRVYVAYEKTAEYFNARGSAAKCVGNPVRAAFRAASAQSAAQRGAQSAAERGLAFIESLYGGDVVIGNKKILLVLGGSQGAKEINDLITQCLEELTQNFFVVHQTGETRFPSPKPQTPSPKPNYLPIAYIKDEMPDLLAASDLVLGRSGAGTVWEAATAGKPMLLIPLAGSGTRGDQVENAAYFFEQGAAIMLVHPTKDELLGEIDKLINDTERLRGMGQASKSIGERDACKTICADIIENFVNTTLEV
jgi:UDP-N-acetylglucosamine--N-acetylmuramyl-(pentapeptide) pyrophosphoryl-undecaprenol N-acetylglucosamine transferase